MAKKENVQRFIPPVEEPQVKIEEQPLFESEAYGSPQPDSGMDTTVTKPVGIGGPVPIVAPKHNTIQLQPIIVPLAVVPYMTQDSDVLRTESDRQGAASAQSFYGGAENADFERVENGKKKDKTKVKNNSGAGRARAMAFFMFLFSAVQVVFYLLAKFSPSLFGLDFSELNVIDGIVKLIKTGEVAAPFTKLNLILYAVSAGGAALAVLISLVCLIAGKYARGLTSVLCLIAAAPVGVVIILKAVAKTFALNAQLTLVILVAVAAVAFLFSIVFAFSKSKKNAKEIDEKKANFDVGSEI